MAYAYVGSAQNASNGNTITYSPTAGNYLVLFSVTSGGGGTPTVTVTDNGTGGGGWTNQKNGVADGSGEWVSIVTCGTASTGATTITVTYNGGTPGSVFLAIVEYSGLSSTGWQGVSLVNLQTTPGTGTNAVTSNSLTVGTAPAALIGWTIELGANGGVTAGTSPIAFTRRVNGNVNMVEDGRVTSTGSYAATFTYSHGASDNADSYVLAITEARPANIVQQTQVWNFGDTITCPAFGSAVTAGNAIVLVAYLYPVSLAISSSPVVSDGTANSYTLAQYFASPTNTFAITFTAPPTGTSGTLTANFGGTTSTQCLIIFSDGELRKASVTNGSTTVTWTTALTGSPTVNATAYNNNEGLAMWYAQNSAGGTVTPQFTSTTGGTQALYGAEITNVARSGIFLGAIGNVQFGPGTSPNTINSGTLTINQNAVLFGFCSDVSTVSVTPVSAGTGFTAQATVWTSGTYGLSVAEDATINASTAVTYTANSGRGADTFYTLAMALAGPGPFTPFTQTQFFVTDTIIQQ